MRRECSFTFSRMFTLSCAGEERERGGKRNLNDSDGVTSRKIYIKPRLCSSLSPPRSCSGRIIPRIIQISLINSMRSCGARSLIKVIIFSPSVETRGRANTGCRDNEKTLGSESKLFIFFFSKVF